MDPPIRSASPYAFSDSLVHQNQLVNLREDYDPVFRGDVRTSSCYSRTHPEYVPPRSVPGSRLTRLARWCCLTAMSLRNPIQTTANPK
jgi:hypothetical protein